MMRERPTNTSKDETGPWTLGRNPNAIVQQEARGQQELCDSGALPTDIQPDGFRAELEAMGVVFGEPFNDDPLFMPATLPDGWSKRPSEHAMHSDLVNADGEVVANIFYKAAFYDRRAWLGKPH